MICPVLGFRAFRMYIFKVQGFYECPLSWVQFTQFRILGILQFCLEINDQRTKSNCS